MAHFGFKQKKRKWCPECDTWKTTTENFGKNNPTQDGWNARCKSCEGKESEEK